MRSRLPELLLPVFSLVLAAGVLELGFAALNRAAERSRIPHPHGEMSDFTRYHPILGWDGIPGVHRPLVRHVVKLNSFGNRSPEATLAKPEGVRRVVILGDSQAWSLGVGDDETIGVQLEARLNARGGQRWEVVNTGIGGYGTDQAYLKHLIQGLRYDPDVVVEIAFKNDLGENAATSAWHVGKPRFYFEGSRLCLGNVPPAKAEGWPEDALLPDPPRQLAWSQTWRFLQRRSWRFGQPPQPDPADMQRLREHLDCIANRESYAGDGDTIMKELLRRLDVLERSRGGQLVTLFVPRPVEYRRKRPRPTYYDAVAAELRRSGLAVLDLLPYGQSRRLTADELFLSRDSHLSVRGCALAAEMLAEEILRRDPVLKER